MKFNSLPVGSIFKTAITNNWIFKKVDETTCRILRDDKNWLPVTDSTIYNVVIANLDVVRLP